MRMQLGTHSDLCRMANVSRQRHRIYWVWPLSGIKKDQWGTAVNGRHSSNSSRLVCRSWFTAQPWRTHFCRCFLCAEPSSELLATTCWAAWLQENSSFNQEMARWRLDTLSRMLPG